MSIKTNAVEDRDFILQGISVDKVSDVNIDENEEIEFKNKLKYRIKSINENNVRILIDIEAGFEPQIMFVGKLKFIAFIEFEKDVTEDYVTENIEDILGPVGSEITYLLSVFTRSMGGSPLILPPRIAEYTKIESK